MKVINGIALLLASVGAINWGLIGIFDFNLVTFLFGSGSFYVLRASGNSMIDAQIDDGDLVIIREQENARLGDIVVALTDEEKNTLKRLCYNRETGEYYLHPENQALEDVYVKQLRVQGVATHVIKELK